MAQAGFTPISLYFSSTAAAVPTSGNLANGELALNIADMKLYAKNSAGAVTLLASNASTTGVDSLSFGSTGLTPSTATTGAITVAGTLNVANGGTGSTSLTAGRVLFGAGTSAVGNSANLFWDNGNSRLGIGTATPRGPIDAIGRSYFQASGSNSVLTLLNTSGGDGSILVTGTSTTLNYAFNTYSTSNALYIQNDGNVGIGTSSPQAKLQVLNTIKVSSSDQSQGNVILGDGSTTNFNVGIARWNGSTNAAGTGGIGYFSQGTVNLGGHYFYTGDAVAGSTTERFRIGTLGQIGLSGANYGTSGQVLTSGGSGSAPTWAAAGGGSQAFVAFGSTGGL